MPEYIEKEAAKAIVANWPMDTAKDNLRACDALDTVKASKVREYVPVEVRCRDDCYWVRDDFGDEYTPPYSECGKDFSVFEDFDIEPCYGEHDEADCPDCPFYLNYEQIKQMESEYHACEPITTADKIRAMSVDEMVETFKKAACPPPYDPHKGCMVPDDCATCWREWLTSPA